MWCSRDAMQAALECRESSKGRNVAKTKCFIADRRDKMVGKSGDESREEKSVPRFAGCDGGANKSGLSHVDFEAKATIQSAESARETLQISSNSNSNRELRVQGHCFEWPGEKEEKARGEFWNRKPWQSPQLSSSDSASNLVRPLDLFGILFGLCQHMQSATYF